MYIHIHPHIHIRPHETTLDYWDMDFWGGDDCIKAPGKEGCKLLNLEGESWGNLWRYHFRYYMKEYGNIWQFCDLHDIIMQCYNSAKARSFRPSASWSYWASVGSRNGGATRSSNTEQSAGVWASLGPSARKVVTLSTKASFAMTSEARISKR